MRRAGSLWHKRAGASNSSDLILDIEVDQSVIDPAIITGYLPSAPQTFEQKLTQGARGPGLRLHCGGSTQPSTVEMFRARRRKTDEMRNIFMLKAERSQGTE